MFTKMLSNPEMLAWAFLGALLLYIINRSRSHQPFSFLSVINIDTGRKAKPSTILIDMVISSALGVLVVFVLASPDTERQAMFAGLGWTGLLSAATKGEQQ